MWSYAAPLAHMRFVIDEVLQAPAQWRDCGQELDADTAAQVLEEAARFAAGVLAPLNGPADLQGCRWVAGTADGHAEVTTPDGYADAYRAFVEGGWPALACEPDWGGQGLPKLLNAALYEMLWAANHGWTMYPGLSHGAYECVLAYGSDELKQRYLPQLASGRWLATMAITEPQAGSDLSQVRTKAMQQQDGSLRISGSKIFISGGEHDLSDNIVHLVLCRLPDAPAGTRGLSLALCPKWLPDGSRNAIRCDGIEKKMGIKGSATCALVFDDATGWLVGQPHRGLAAMFVMMNAARLNVGLQGLGHLDTAQRNALAYACERVQSRAPGQERAGPIALHPSARQTLWRLRAISEGARVVAYWAAQQLDLAEQHSDEAARRDAHLLAGVLTPVVKACCTAWGFEGAAQAQQLWGGYGYVHEYGIEQTVRDARIAMVYEGTNEIQALDLLQRKLLANDGGWALLHDEIAAEAARCEAAGGAAADFAAPLRAQLALAARTLKILGDTRDAAPERIAIAADDVLQGCGLLLLGWAWARSTRAAQQRADDPGCAQTISAARFGLQWLLPQGDAHWQRAQRGDLDLPAAPALR